MGAKIKIEGAKISAGNNKKRQKTLRMCQPLRGPVFPKNEEIRLN